MILLINICKERLHYYEFVKPIEDILKKNNLAFFTLNYKEIQEKILERADKAIICGTSLKDNEFMQNSSFFSWIKSFNKPLLGICGGMQVIGRMVGGKIRKEQEIGFFKEKFHKKFLETEGWKEVYHLHNYFADFSNSDEIEAYSYSDKEIPQAIKHREKEIYGVLFHPEVRNKEIILNFCKY